MSKDLSKRIVNRGFLKEKLETNAVCVLIRHEASCHLSRLWHQVHWSRELGGQNIHWSKDTHVTGTHSSPDTHTINNNPQWGSCPISAAQGYKVRKKINALQSCRNIKKLSLVSVPWWSLRPSPGCYVCHGGSRPRKQEVGIPVWKLSFRLKFRWKVVTCWSLNYRSLLIVKCDFTGRTFFLDCNWSVLLKSAPVWTWSSPQGSFCESTDARRTWGGETLPGRRR